MAFFALAIATANTFLADSNPIPAWVDAILAFLVAALVAAGPPALGIFLAVTRRPKARTAMATPNTTLSEWPTEHEAEGGTKPGTTGGLEG